MHFVLLGRTGDLRLVEEGGNLEDLLHGIEVRHIQLLGVDFESRLANEERGDLLDELDAMTLRYATGIPPHRCCPRFRHWDRI